MEPPKDDSAPVLAGTEALEKQQAPGETQSTPKGPVGQSLTNTCDRTQATQFLQLLGGIASDYVFQAFDDNDKGEKDPGLTKQVHGTLEEHWDRLVKLNRCGAGVYVTVNETDGHGRRANNIKKARAVWQDADRPDALIPGLEPQVVVSTSPGKYQRYWLIDPRRPPGDWASWDAVQRRIAEQYRGDSSAQDRARVLRLPGFYHLKDRLRPHLVMLITARAGRYSWEEIVEAIPPWVDPTAGRHNEAPATTIPEGMRNATLTSMAGAMRYRGMSGPAIAAALQEENRRCTPPLPAREVKAIARSIGRYPPGVRVSAGDSVGFVGPAALDLQALAATTPKPPEFIVPGWLPAGEVTMLSGHGGSGKSAISLDLGVSISEGLPWCGLPTQKRRVAFLSLEDPQSVLHWRLGQICDGLVMPDLAELNGLDVYDASHLPAELMVEDHELGVVETAAYTWLANIMATRQVLIIDGASDGFGGNENVRRHVRAFIRALRRAVPHDGAVLLLAHVDKNTAKSPDTSQGYSGSTAWSNSVRSRWYLSPNDWTPGGLLLELQKANYAPAGAQIRFKWDSARQLFVGSQGAAGSVADQVEAELAGIVAALRACASSQVDVPAAKSGPRTAYHVLVQRPELPAALSAGDAGKKKFWQRIEALRAMGRVVECSIRRADRHFTACLALSEKEMRACGQ